MATTKPSHIPKPSPSPSASPAPPSPSAFPSLSGSAQPSDAQPSASQPPTGIPSYAQHAKKTLPPTKAPEGVSVPASALPRLPSKERIQPSSNGKDSPYARPAPGANGASAQRIKKKSIGGPGARGAVGANGVKKPAAAGQQSSAEDSAQEKKKERPRTVPGMPASMLPPPVPGKKKAASHGRTKSDVGLAQTSSAESGNEANIPGIGKKRRASLRKVLPPGSSKLSALAPSFEFAPRSATSPNLSSYLGSSSSAEDSALSADESASPVVPTSGAVDTPTSGALTPSFRELSLEAEDELEEGEIREEKLPSAAPSATPASPISATEQAAIKETVGSAGAQGDEFRAKSLSQADQEGAEEAAPARASEQSATPAKPSAVPSALEAEKQQAKEDKATLEPEQPRSDRSFGAFLEKAFAPVQEGRFAPLEVPAELRSKAEDAADKGKKVEKIPGAVSASPIADLAYLEKKGWWSDDYVPVYSGPLNLSPAPPSSSKARPNPEAAGPAAVEPAASLYTASHTLLKYPAWTPPAPPAADDRTVAELAASETQQAGRLASFLGSAFTERADAPTSADAVASSSALPSASLLSASSAPAASPSLASYLPTSFAPLAATGFAPLGELEAEALAHAPHRAADIPTSAEEIANQPSLDEQLDVDSVKPKREGWWTPGYGESSSTVEPALVDEKLVKETVGTAGAQADGFRSKGFEEADREGAREVEGNKASEQSVPKEDWGKSSEEKKVKTSGTSTPLGSFLNTAFTTSSVPSASDFPASTLETADKFVNTQLTSGTVRSAGAQGDAFVGQSFTAADRVGVVEEGKVPEEQTHGSNALGQYLTTHFAGDASSPTPVVSVGSTGAFSSTATPTAGTSSSSPTPADKSDDSDGDARKPPSNSGDKDAPSLTLAVASAWHTAPWTRKIWAVIASVAINVGLPFVNGVMLGFGELFARNVLGVRLGWPLHSSSPTVPAAGRANTAGVGLRAAGTGPRVGTEVPGNAAAKTAVEAVAEGAAAQ
ncbi:hypothetical protein JCM10207_006117 [Rhodosporidiobolus poonsookiae]